MTPRTSALLILALSLAPAALAMNSAEIKGTFGSEYFSYKVGASADLDPNGDWNADLAFHQARYTATDAPGWYNLFFLELNYFAAESLSVSGNYSYSYDSSNVRSTGPGLSLFYTLFAPGPASGGDGSTKGTPRETWTEAPPPADLFTVGLDNLVLFYQAEVPSSASLTNGNDLTDGNIRLTQFVPSLFLDYSLIPGRINVHASGSTAFYSDDPMGITASSDTATAAAELAAPDSLLAGLLWTSWHAGTTLTLPYTLKLSGTYGRQKQVYPEEWVDNYELGLSGKPLAFLRVKIAWRRYTSSFGGTDLFTAGLRFLF